MATRNKGAGPCRAIQALDRTIQRHYPGLIGAVHACLAVFGAMALNGRTKPLCVIFETASGYGKTAVLQMVFAAPRTALAKYVYRSDKFTPKAFVTHTANVKKGELAKMDLLPKLHGKVLVTKELAPIFRGREEELRENFSILISVLDGKGFTSDSGMRGKRGYERAILFNWIGATTPLPPATHRLMSQLGTRLLFFEVPAIQPTEDELLNYALRGESKAAEDDCQKAARKFLVNFFRDHPVGSLSPKAIQFSQPRMLQLVRWAQLVCDGRAEVKFEKEKTNWEPVAAAKPEGPWKVVNYFKELAIGHAVICGRNAVDDSDLELVAHVALSSIPGHLRPLIRELRRADRIDSTTAAKLCGVTPPTARNYLKQLALLGIADLAKGAPNANLPDVITLNKRFHWM